MEAMAYCEDVRSGHGGRVMHMAGRTASQKRYCLCGRVLFVDFVPSGETFSPLFRFSAFARSVIVSECPCCGKPLDIDEVR